MKKSRFIPELFLSLKNYSFSQFGKDLVSGIIVAIIALPLSVALALASGVGPNEGIYTAIVAGFLIAVFGGSKVQIAGPTAAFATIVAGIIAKNGIDGMILATLIAGVLLIIMGVCKVGGLIKFVPYTITTGFTAGIAVTIIIGQLKDFFGLTYPAGTATVETIDKVKAFALNITTLNWQALAVGAVSFAVLMLWPKVSKKIPGSLIAVLIGIFGVKLLNLDVNTIGDLYTVSQDLPSFRFPAISFEAVQNALPDGVTIAVLAAIESLLSCVVADGMIGSKHNSNQELIGQGIGNIGSVLFGGIPATGAIARTAANIRNGGKTPIAAIVHSVILVLVLVLLMPYASMIPMPTIAAILFQVAINMCGYKKFVKLIKTAPVSDIIVLVATFLLTVIFDLVVAIEVGMIAACVLFVKRMSDEGGIKGWKEYDQNDPDATNLKQYPKSVCVYEISGPIFFGASDRLLGVTANEGVRAIVLRMRSVPSLDASALIAIEDLYDNCTKSGVTLVMSHVNEQPIKALKKAGLYDKIGADNFCANIDAALERAKTF